MVDWETVRTVLELRGDAFNRRPFIERIYAQLCKEHDSDNDNDSDSGIALSREDVHWIDIEQLAKPRPDAAATDTSSDEAESSSSASSSAAAAASSDSDEDELSAEDVDDEEDVEYQTVLDEEHQLEYYEEQLDMQCNRPDDSEHMPLHVAPT
ncbi:hypothetical protein SYNPS1DRAFT_31193 [Syncephalis pseudoplumigaleata]|uniref:Uncharacterized protein n=1 Tax=Syncephalis pseudoplumigaleata TaxID=1712513 RepID=A0A4P9YTP7_9FUNG|nr:hypothetical protein SYNPS1DRAFT_31193 [Syncephalis pseudoplumigaleata]|eukprot:RKP23108.1 hypothetical protein SYNPS1DRAFT_31193 [Syncephalis pseudoplumigaleata]